jgi:hypothetical protein
MIKGKSNDLPFEYYKIKCILSINYMLNFKIKLSPYNILNEWNYQLDDDKEI